MHTHFLPPNIQAKVWAQFDQAGPKIGRDWPIRYRGTEEERVAQLREFGVRRFSSLPYAHRPGIAGYLNDWARGFSGPGAGVPVVGHVLPRAGRGDVRPRPGRGRASRCSRCTCRWGSSTSTTRCSTQVWGTLADAGTPVVIHAGSGPVGNEFTGPEGLRRVLAEHPSLTVVVAHMGAPEYAAFLELAERYERTHLDTTMMFTDFFDAAAPYPDALLPRLADLDGKVLFGSDFPTIPYPYREALDGLGRLRDREPRLDDDWLRAVCWHNGEALLGPPPAVG